MSTEIKVPTLGESVSEATIGQWFKKVGDHVEQDETLVELETDKVTVEVPAPAAGVLQEIVVKEGETVEVGALIGTIGEGEGAGDTASSEATERPSGKANEAAASSGSGGYGDESQSDTQDSEQGGSKSEAKGGASLTKVVVPSAGESVTEATVGTIFKKVGDTVAVDEALLELETDKAAQEVPSPVAGVIRELAVSEGDEVKVGALLMKIEDGASGGSSRDGSGSAVANRSPEGANQNSDAPARGDKGGEAEGSSRPPAPSARKMMAENDMSADKVTGSGRDGQILKGDVLEAVSRAAPSSPQETPKAAPQRAASAPDESAREERVKMTRLRQTIAKRLKSAQDTAAMLTTFNEVDMTATMEMRKKYKDLFDKKHGVKLGFMGFFTKAVCHALKEIPAVNAEIDGNEIVYKNFCNIGMAVGTDKGLVVPVIKDADRMTIAEVEKELGRLARLARDGKLGVSDMQGGTFTITNGGVYGSLMSTPILNAPQSGILGMHKIQERPMAIGGQVVIRPMMYLALSYDHRIVDGKEAVTFLVRVKESLEDPERLILDL
ncbi:2-oxoglutarate dehydrogenase complex dihydrolipoyllysine-residue succinyltransferase [Fulvimarina sp. 2208YS6-2-32]|uniref:Dihydrolipoyllysine-residue succinyltransferase n=1 Tax=Fulvimarina uroteuthidis TaxID=3098149 RepID=A0ABU5I5R1_9HYPH|nr:2-oxoglutarate dehydrogenase complex dihydrolipoyllysine-residue succinyltransferase [Fulvimarina sp. 2208YS6-2-32]MDY8110714.1 2-oxoglutarate dehydrogenase complex dihydrolipoyllysine-residue succinyltransferase [Fulvimarina sp. 2208YS6-2-32]